MATDIIARALASVAQETADNAHQRIDALPKGFVYRGAVSYRADLDNLTAEIGDVYTVKYKGTSGTEPWGAEFVWGPYEGVNQWNEVGTNYDADIAALAQSIQNEVAARSSADITLQTNITNEVNARESAITAVNESINQEAISREQADTTLQNNINTKQDTLISGTNIKTINNTALLGTGNIDVKTYQPFPNGDLSGTLQQVVSAILAFPTKAQGMAYLGGINGSCTPFGYGNVECTVTFMTSNIAVLTVSSSNIAPYHWEYNTAQNDYQWRAFLVESNVKTINSQSIVGTGDIVIDVPTKTSELTNDGDGTNPFLTQHQSLASYRTSADQDVIDTNIQSTINARASTYVLSCQMAAPTAEDWTIGKQFYRPDGTRIESYENFLSYINMTGGPRPFGNTKFNSTNHRIYLDFGYLLVYKNRVGGSGYTNQPYFTVLFDSNLKLGDKILVEEIEIPDRWYTNNITLFLPLESSVGSNVATKTYVDTGLAAKQDSLSGTQLSAITNSIGIAWEDVTIEEE